MCSRLISPSMFCAVSLWTCMPPVHEVPGSRTASLLPLRLPSCVPVINIQSTRPCFSSACMLPAEAKEATWSVFHRDKCSCRWTQNSCMQFPQRKRAACCARVRSLVHVPSHLRKSCRSAQLGLAWSVFHRTRA